MRSISWAKEYYKSLLTNEDKKIYDIIYRKWIQLKTEVSFSSYSSDDDVKMIIESIVKDHPELFWVNYFQYTIYRSIMSTKLLTSNFFDTYKIKDYQKDVSDWRYRVLNQIPMNFSKTDIIWLLYDYLSREVEYGENGDKYSHTILGSMMKNKHLSVCEGISKSFKYLCDGMDIPCIVIYGSIACGYNKRELHAWNIVESNNKNRHIDVTSELVQAHKNGKANKRKFLYIDDEMTRYSWDRTIVPKCI